MLVEPARKPFLRDAAVVYRLDWPRAIFFTFFFFEPRGSVRLALGAAFLRAARFTFLRSSLSSILDVSANANLFRCNLFRVSRQSGQCDLYVNRDWGAAKGAVARAARMERLPADSAGTPVGSSANPGYHINVDRHD